MMGHRRINYLKKGNSSGVSRTVSTGSRGLPSVLRDTRRLMMYLFHRYEPIFASANYLTEPPHYVLVLRSEPSSRTLLTGEQPDSWDLLQPRARTSRPHLYTFPCTSRITTGADYIFVMSPFITLTYYGEALSSRHLHSAWAEIQSLRGYEPILYFIDSMRYGAIIVVSFFVSARLQYIRYPLSRSR